MTFSERIQEYVEILEGSAKLLENSKPSIETILKSIDDIFYANAATEFRKKRHEDSERRHERLKAICRDKIQLVAEAMRVGISEEGALQILFSEFPAQPEAEFSQTVSDALTKAAPLIATVATPRVSTPFPFPGEIPTPEVGEDFPNEEDGAEEHEIVPLNGQLQEE